MSSAQMVKNYVYLCEEWRTLWEELKNMKWWSIVVNTKCTFKSNNLFP